MVLYLDREHLPSGYVKIANCRMVHRNRLFSQLETSIYEGILNVPYQLYGLYMVNIWLIFPNNGFSIKNQPLLGII